MPLYFFFVVSLLLLVSIDIQCFRESLFSDKLIHDGFHRQRQMR